MSSTKKAAKKVQKKSKQTALVPRDKNASLTEVSKLYERVRAILDEARQNVARSVNSEMARAYWLAG
jgi:hypothetical protein